MASLVLASPKTDASQPTFVITKQMTAIGSSNANDVVVKASGVSDTHAVLQFDGQTFTIQTTDRKLDLAINGKRKRKVVLSEGDVVQMGDAVFRFSLLHLPVDLGDEPAEELQGFRRLHQLSQQLLTNSSLPSVLESLMDSVIEISNGDKGFLILTDGNAFAIKVARNLERENIEDAVEHVSDSIIAKVIESKQSLIVSDAINDNEFNSSQSVINLNLSSVMCVPLVDRERLIGIIYVGNDDIANLFTRKHLDLLETFAAQASLIVANAIMMNELRMDNELLQSKLADKRFGSIVGSCKAMQDVFRTIEKVAPTNVNCLITGETGTGKELIANEIHQRSARADGPFVTINCGAIPESLLESELFGHVKGAFTGATATREGKFQAANNGTIFLDEIGEMPLNLQVKLLRVLQERVITKVGATQPERVDIRVVAATNRNLERAVKSNEFREDLFYRLNVVMFHLPRLADRGEDVVTIAKYLIHNVCEELNLPERELSEKATDAIRSYDWPGNIRQLENRLKKALVLSDSKTLSPADLELAAEDLEPIIPLSDAKEKFAFAYIMKALERNGGNRTKAAKELGVDPRTIFRYLEKDFS